MIKNCLARNVYIWPSSVVVIKHAKNECRVSKIHFFYIFNQKKNYFSSKEKENNVGVA